MAIVKSNLERDISSDTLRIWEDVQDKLLDILYKYKIAPTEPAFRASVNLWLGSGTYDAFIEDYEESN